MMMPQLLMLLGIGNGANGSPHARPNYKRSRVRREDRISHGQTAVKASRGNIGMRLARKNDLVNFFNTPDKFGLPPRLECASHPSTTVQLNPPSPSRNRGTAREKVRYIEPYAGSSLKPASSNSIPSRSIWRG